MGKYDFDVICSPTIDTTNAVNILGYANNESEKPLRELASEALKTAKEGVPDSTGTIVAKDFTIPMEVINAVAVIANHAIPENKINYKYAENKIIADFQNYIDETYGQHYKSTTNKIECFDAWIAMGDATPTFRNTAIKYLWRYGKKNSYVESKKDLFKALHYVLMCLYNDHYKDM